MIQQFLYLAGNVSEAVKRLGAMTHYVSDATVFVHVMGASTGWGRRLATATTRTM